LQERAVTTRRRILESAAVVFDRYGYAGATMAQILEEAGLTKGALYFHFASKEELAKALFSEEERWSSLLAAPRSDRPVQDVIDFTHIFAEALIKDALVRASIRMAIEYGTFTNQDQFTTYSMWAAALHTPLSRAQKRGHLRPDVDITTTADTVVACFTGLQIMSQVVSQRSDLHERLAAWWTLTLPGLVPTLQAGGYQVGGSTADSDVVVPQEDAAAGL